MSWAMAWGKERASCFLALTRTKPRKSRVQMCQKNPWLRTTPYHPPNWTQFHSRTPHVDEQIWRKLDASTCKDCSPTQGRSEDWNPMQHELQVWKRLQQPIFYFVRCISTVVAARARQTLLHAAACCCSLLLFATEASTSG